ncbi:MAG: hypothetical protein ACKOES_12135, partial [Planctomycetaceae bacterium]
MTAIVRLTATTLLCVLVDAEQFGLAAQAGSAPQPGSQPAEQSGSLSQQLVQLERHFFAAWIALRRSRIGVHFFRTPQQPASAAQPGSQQAVPASQAGSAQPLPA